MGRKRTHLLRWAQQVLIFITAGFYFYAWGQTTILSPIWRDSILMLKEKQTEWLQTWYAMVRILWNFGKYCSSHPHHFFSVHFLSGSKEFELNFKFGWRGGYLFKYMTTFQYSLHNNAPSSRKLLKMDVLTSETCWAVNWHNKASVIMLVYLYSNVP